LIRETDYGKQSIQCPGQSKPSCSDGKYTEHAEQICSVQTVLSRRSATADTAVNELWEDNPGTVQQSRADGTADDEVYQIN